MLSATALRRCLFSIALVGTNLSNCACYAECAQLPEQARAGFASRYDFFTNYGQYMPRMHCLRTAEGSPDWPWITSLIVLNLLVVAGYVRIFMFWRKCFKSEEAQDRDKKLMQLAWIFALCATCGYGMSTLIFFWPAYRLLAIFLAALALITWRFAFDLKPFRQAFMSHRLQRQLNAALQTEKENLQKLVDSAPVAMIMTDESGRIRSMNDEAIAVFGYSQEEMLNRDIELLIPDRFRRRHPNLRNSYVANPSERIMNSGRTVFGLRKNGTEFPAEVGLRTIETDGGGLTIVAAVNDVSDAFEARKAAAESEKRFYAIANTSPLAMWVCDESSNCVWLNKRWLTYTGTTLEDNLGFGWSEAVHPDDREGTTERYRQAFQNRARFTLHYRLKRYDGSFRWHTSFGAPRFDDSGTFMGYIGVCADTHDEREMRDRLESTNASLQEKEAIYRSLIDQSANFVGLLTPDGKLIDANRTALRASGVHSSDVLGLPFWETPWWTHSASLQNKLKNAVVRTAAGEVVEFEATHPTHDGDTLDIAFSLKPVRNENGETLYLIPEGRDITQHKRREAELENLLAKLDASKMELQQANASLRESEGRAHAASRAKSDFLANMSHEIRTPMNAIMGLTEIVLQSELNDLQRDYLSTVSASAESLLQVINDILDFSKIEAGKLELENTEFQIRDIVGDALKSLALKAHAKGLELAHRCEVDVPDVMVGDPGRVRQILVNLVGNAVKFTESGHIVVNVRVAPESSADANRVTIETTVEDTGIGIAPDKLRSIFNEFEQADTSSTRRFGGTGLGLAITSRLVREMNGGITVSSRPGEGSTFCFTAEFGRSDKQATRPWHEAVRKLESERVLVVDDYHINLTILKEMIGAHAHRVDTVSNGAEALSLLRMAASDGVPYSLVVSDVNMPGIDGYALAEKVRNDSTLSSTPIMLLTSSGDPGDVKRMGRLSISGRLLKPVKQSELLELMVRALGLTDFVAVEDTPASPNTSEARSAGISYRILLAEDSVPNQKLALAVLGSAGHHVVVVENGKEAVDAAANAEFDVVLMDIQMPEMDGLQATAAIRDHEGDGRHTPIIAMTAHALTDDRAKCLQAGMDDYVSKPVRPAELFAALDRVLNLAAEEVESEHA